MKSDVALIELKTPIIFDEKYVKPVCLSSSPATAGDECIISGNIIHMGCMYLFVKFYFLFDFAISEIIECNASEKICYYFFI